MTPLYAHVGEKLIESAYFATVIQDKKASLLFRISPKGYREAISNALKYEDHYFEKTHWEMHFYTKLLASKKIQTFFLYGRTLMLQLQPLKQNEQYQHRLVDHFQKQPIFLFHPLKALFFRWRQRINKYPVLVNIRWYLDQISPTQVRWSWSSRWGEAALRFTILSHDHPCVIQSYYFHPKGLIGSILGIFCRPFHRRWLIKNSTKITL